MRSLNDEALKNFAPLQVLEIVMDLFVFLLLVLLLVILMEPSDVEDEDLD